MWTILVPIMSPMQKTKTLNINTDLFLRKFVVDRDTITAELHSNF